MNKLRTIILTLMLIFTFSALTFAQNADKPISKPTITWNLDGNWGWMWNMKTNTTDVNKVDKLYPNSSKFFVDQLIFGANAKYDKFTGNASVIYKDKLSLYTANINYNPELMKDFSLNVDFGRMINKWYTYTYQFGNDKSINYTLSDHYNFINRNFDGLNLNFGYKEYANFSVATYKSINDGFEFQKGNKPNILLTGVFKYSTITLGGLYSYQNNDLINSDTKVPDTILSRNIYGVNGNYDYTFKKLGTVSIGAEYLNLIKTNPGDTISNLFGETTYSGWIKLSPNVLKCVSLLIRYDSDRPINVPADNRNVLSTSLICSPIENTSFSLTFKNIINNNIPDINGVVKSNYQELWFNTGIKF